MRLGPTRTCKTLHGVLYPKFQRDCLGLVTDDGDDYEIKSLPGQYGLNLLYEPVKVVGRVTKNHGLKVIDLEAENEPPEVENASIQTTAFPHSALPDASA